MVPAALAVGSEARARARGSTRVGATATCPSTPPSPRPCSTSSSASPTPPCSSTTTTSTSRPRLVRERAPGCAAHAHFVHIPWAQPDYWRVLPEPDRVAIHDGLLANDVVGFHTHRWRGASSLLRGRSALDASCARGVTGPPDLGRRRRVRGARESEAVLEAERELVAGRPEQLILRVDRTDPSKNVVRGLPGVRAAARAPPGAPGRVQMLALLDPSRQDIPEYASTSARSSASRGRRLEARRAGSRCAAASRTTSAAPSPPTSSSTSCS